MNMTHRYLLGLLIAFFALLGHAPATAAESTGAATSKTFTSTTADLPNPERGWYGSPDYNPPYFYINNWTQANLQAEFNKGIRLAIGVLYLGDSRTNPTLPASFFTMFDQRMAWARTIGIKVIIRPAYNYDSSGSDATLSVAIEHMRQLAPYFKKNADVIAYAQGGFIGAWGEWHSSTTLCLDTSPTASCRVQVIDGMLAAYHPATPLQLRYIKYLAGKYPTALTKAQAFDGSAASRLGSHNDCFMSNTTDVGTYQSSVLTLANPERARVASDSNYTPFGGETCSGFSPMRMACSDILSEGQTYHLTYLNRNFYTAFHDSWTSGGCFDQVSRSIGYRFQLDSISHQGSAVAGQSITANVPMRNLGWSRIFSARRLNLQLRNVTTGATIVCLGDQDLRSLPPVMSSSYTYEIRCTLPASTAAGTYDVYIAIPDIWPNTAALAPFAVRPANADNTGQGQLWDATNARFKTGTQITVAGG